MQKNAGKNFKANPPPYSTDLTPCDFHWFPKKINQKPNKPKALRLTLIKTVKHYKSLVSEVSQKEWHQCFEK